MMMAMMTVSSMISQKNVVTVGNLVIRELLLVFCSYPTTGNIASAKHAASAAESFEVPRTLTGALEFDVGVSVSLG